MNVCTSVSCVPRRVDAASRRAILVLGMHRSGTSAVTRCLNLLGVDLGKRLLPPADGNPKGFWENEGVVEIHEELLAEFGSTWYDAQPLPKNWLTSRIAVTAQDKLVELIENEFGGSPLWAVKDPRLCRFVPLWRKVLAERGIGVSVLLVVRHPAEVAYSLEARNDLPRETAYRLWLEHFSEAEAASRDLPRSVISYDGLLEDWRGGLTQVARGLHVKWPVPLTSAAKAISVFLDPNERHHSTTVAPDAVPAVLDRLYRLCRMLESDAQDWQEISCLVDIYALMTPAFSKGGEIPSGSFHAANYEAESIERAIDDSLKSIEKVLLEVRAGHLPAKDGLDYAALYYRSGEQGFAEARVRQVPFKWGSGSASALRFEIPAGAAAIRFDPSGQPGAFNLRELRVNGRAVSDLRDRVHSVNRYLLDHRNAEGVWFASNDADPWIELGVADLSAPTGPMVVQLHCIRRPLENVLGSLIASVSDEMQRRFHSDIASSFSTVAQQLSGIHGVMQQQLEASQLANARVEAEVAAAREREAQLRQQLEATQAAKAKTEAEMETSRQRESRLLKESFAMAGGAALAQQTQKLNAELESRSQEMQDRFSQLESEHDRLSTEHTNLLVSHTALDQQLGAIKASTSWRMLVALHAMLERMPRDLRLFLRKVLKAVWWLVTPWWLARRLRFLNQRRESIASMLRNSDLGAEQGCLPEISHRSPVAAVPSQPGYRYLTPLANPERIRNTLLALAQPPSFSIVVPVYDTDADLLRLTVASVEAQWYPRWDLILVDDHSPSMATRKILEGFTDPRITVVRLDENKGISGATNEGIRRASSDYIVFLDHDDELTPDCLFELAQCIDRDGADYLYSDEDKIDIDGEFKEPFFKPDWSPDTMMSIMLTCHVSCVRRALALEVGGLRSEYDGSQDWDFVLRVTEHAQRISHIPKVLYHWRTIPASCASDLQAKPYAIEASKRAREDALRRRGLSGELVPVPELPGYYRTRYHLQGEPLFSIIVPSKNNRAVLRACIDSILDRTSYRRFEIIVVNNGSTEPATVDYLNRLRSRDQITVLDHDYPFNYSEINNLGVRHAKGDILVFLNDDTEVLSKDWLDYMGGYAQLPHVGAVGAKLLYPGAKIVQHAGVLNLAPGPCHAFPKLAARAPGYFVRNMLEYNWIAITGACMMTERSKFEQAGGFDEDLPVTYNDTAFCFSLAEHGFYQVVCPGVELIHHESLTRGDDMLDAAKVARLDKERTLLFKKHPDFVGRDPFYNPNLDVNDPHFQLRKGSRAFDICVVSDDLLAERSDDAECALDAIDGKPVDETFELQRSPMVTFTGWAGDGHGNAAGKLEIIMKGDNGNSCSYCASTVTGLSRPDVAQALGRVGLAMSGYRLTVSLANIEPGTYSLYALRPDTSEPICRLAARCVVQ